MLSTSQSRLSATLHLSVVPRSAVSHGKERVAKRFVTSLKDRFLLLVVRMLLVARPGAPSSVLARSSDARVPSSDARSATWWRPSNSPRPRRRRRVSRELSKEKERVYNHKYIYIMYKKQKTKQKGLESSNP